ncbi:MAG: Cytosine/adenosine deaminase or related metal-dependent hydrolase [Thermodesulfobacterium sp.]|uniref:5-methylthioadenosine/S-adenosylhomocysteine deaminase n=1 Tax=Candidatus Thermodesulfobacterium syntrophicum TaxID=3060442 RepID=A0AAE3TFK6_9BACT|nr:Cytosine/adenosine deaminase or related metal-dependent hydrolase [Candidatus Thermodesulfobacterium syntrophicum]
MVKILSAKWILVSPEKVPLKNGCIVIENDKIIDLGLKGEIIFKYQNAELIDLGSKIIFPGLVNAHTHAPMSIFRGIAEDLPLMVWLREYIFPIEAKLKEDWVYWGTKLSLIEMIKSGITAFCDMYLFEKEVIKAVEESGLKALLGEGLFDFPSPSYGPLEKGFELTEELLKSFERNSRIKIAVSPHTLYTCSPETVKKCIDLSEKFNAKLHIHLCETEEEIKEVKKKYGKRPVEILKELGGINENLIAVHCVKLNLEEIELMAKHSAGIVHCPESNLKLGSGIAPLTEMLKAGVKLGLGTDGPASNNDFDMFSEMRTACLIQKGLKEDPTVIKANDVLNMSTCWGAEILGFSDTGKLLPGYKADLAVLNLSHYSMQPDYNPIALLVYSAKSGLVSDLMVDGQWIMRNYEITSIKEEEVIEKVKNIKKEILSLLSKK